jgi:hypothetical protein
LSAQRLRRKRELQPLSNIKKIFGILSLKGKMRQARIRESLGLVEKYSISD